MCYDWNNIFMDYLSSIPKSKCFSITPYAAKKKPINKGGPVHFFIRISAGSGGPGCETYIDDGYETGSNSHTSVPLNDPDIWVHHMPPEVVIPLIDGHSPVNPKLYPRKLPQQR
jgi:hypothetical protein